MTTFADIWKGACNEVEPNPQGAAGALMAAIGDKLDVEQVEYSRIGRFALFLFDLSELGFKGMDLNVVMIAHPPANDAEAREQAELLSQYKHNIQSVGFCFLITLSAAPTSTNEHISSSLETVFIYGADLERLMTSSESKVILFEVIRRQVQLHRLCPFNTSHEARSDTFRGREREFKRLVYEMESIFLVSGGRRIGKTSLLKRAYNVLRVMPDYLKSDGLDSRVFYFNCLTWGDPFDCFSWLCHSIDPKHENRIGKSERNVAYMLERRSFQGRRPLIFFFDELDGVVDRDMQAGWPFFNVLAKAVSEHWIRVTFAGYRSMKNLPSERGGHFEQSERTSPRSPFYASLQELVLEPLKKEQTSSLVRDPFQSLGIPIRDEGKVVGRIWECSAGHPWVIQFLGEKLFPKASDASPQEVRLEHLDEILSGFELSDFLVSHFLENTMANGQEVVCERLCVFLYAHNRKGQSWTEGEFIEACNRVTQSISASSAEFVGEFLRFGEPS